MRSTPVVSSLVLAALLAAAPAFAAWPHDPLSGVLPVCVAPNVQQSPVSVPDGAGGMILAWLDQRAVSGTSQVYAQRLSASGVPLWAANGIPVCTATGTRLRLIAAPDGAGGAFFAWNDQRAGNSDVYVQRVSANGAALWTANGVNVAVNTADQFLGSLVPDGAGGVFVAWFDARSGVSTRDIYTQHVNAAGSVLLGVGGLALCTATLDQASPEGASDGAGGAIFAWFDGRTGTGDIYAQRVTSAGSLAWTANGVAVCNAAGTQGNVEVLADGVGGAIFCWGDNRGTNSDIYAQRINSAGTLLWSAASAGVAICLAASDQYFPLLVSDGAGGAVIAWNDFRNTTSGEDVYAQRISSAGAPMWTADGVPVCTATGIQSVEALVADGANGAIVSWYDYRSGTGDTDAYAQRLGPTGVTQWTSNGAVIAGGLASQSEITAVSDGSGGAILAFDDGAGNATGTSNDISAMRIERYGQLGSPEPVITSIKDVANDQGGHVKLAWRASYLDVDPSPLIFDYRLWRSVPVSALANRLSPLAARPTRDADEAAATGRPFVHPYAGIDYAWEIVTTQSAGLLPSYSLVAPTTGDSVGGSNPRTAFMVEARVSTSITSDRWFSAPDSGYSVDNLAPAAPQVIAGTYAAGATRLAWQPNHEADLAGYRVYRGTSASFTPGPGNLVASVADTGYVDAAGSPYFYVLTALDAHGNESPLARLTPQGVLAADGAAAHLDFLAPIAPNPSAVSRALHVRFGLARAGRVEVTVFDAAGRRVRVLAEGPQAAGEHDVAWDGRDERGARAGAGLYFVRLRAAGLDVTRRLARVE